MDIIKLEKKEVLNVCEVPKPTLKDNEVLIKTKYVGICGSDIHAFLGHNPFISYPRVLGHEIVGITEDSRSDLFQKGDRVVVDPVLSCGSCYACSIGRHNVCSNLKVFGIHTDGGFQEWVKLKPENLIKIPKELDLKLATLSEPFSIGFEANTRARVNEDDTVTVIGTGPIGLMVSLVAKYIGAKVICLDIDRGRLETAKKLGINYSINTNVDNPLKEIRRITSGEGPSVVIEAVGKAKTIKDTLSYVSSAGRVVILGIIDEDVPISVSEIIKKEVDFLGSRLNRNMFPKVIEMFKNSSIDYSLLMSNIESYDYKSASNVFKNISNSSDNCLKTLLKF